MLQVVHTTSSSVYFILSSRIHVSETGQDIKTVRSVSAIKIVNKDNQLEHKELLLTQFEYDEPKTKVYVSKDDKDFLTIYVFFGDEKDIKLRSFKVSQKNFDKAT